MKDLKKFFKNKIKYAETLKLNIGRNKHNIIKIMNSYCNF